MTKQMTENNGRDIKKQFLNILLFPTSFMFLLYFW